MWKNALIVTGVAAAAVVLLVFLLPTARLASVPTFEPVSAPPTAAVTPESPPPPVPATQPQVPSAGAASDSDAIALLPDSTQVKTPMEQRLDLGLPVSPNPRRAVCEATAKQDIPAVVRDLGNVFADFYTASPEYMGSLRSLASWADSLQSNIKVLRLIEAGRESPAQVAPLLNEQIRQSLDAYNEVAKAKQEYDRRWAAGEVPAPAITENDPYYAENARYEDPTFELQRLHRTIVSSFYILANINESIDGRLLARWVKKPQVPGYACPGMDVWLIDCYFAQQTASPQRDRHQQAFGRTGVVRREIPVSTWQSSWSLRDPVAGATGADLSDMKTISVLAVPETMQLPPSTRFRIIQNFVAYSARQN